MEPLDDSLFSLSDFDFSDDDASPEQNGTFNEPLAPPPILTYDDKDIAIFEIRLWARDHLYAVAIHRSKKDKEGNNIGVYLRCGHGLLYVPRGQQRQGRTKGTGCPFSVALTYHKADSLWHMNICRSSHNHAPMSPTIYP
ncbi:hypothetical protein BJX63DRAFT_217069 [Aspergillus granulosus]|uniref:FAR1 domain-containing protein n=1 Tax=Aspergillus granulosus TaxID=176169 RepID=A0ABR4HDX4_9EURO